MFNCESCGSDISELYDNNSDNLIRYSDGIFAHKNCPKSKEIKIITPIETTKVSIDHHKGEQDEFKEN